MKLPLFSLGIFVTLVLIATGCGNGNSTTLQENGDNPPVIKPAEQSPDPTKPEVTVSTKGGTNHPSQKVVMDFLMELMRGNTQGVVALLSPLAQQEYLKGNSFPFKPEIFEQVEFHITGSDLVDESNPNYFGVRADMVMINSTNEPVPTVWGVRKFGDEYRVANMMFYDDELERHLTFDFEASGNSVGVLSDSPAQQQATNQMPSNNQQPVMQQDPQQMAQPFVPYMQ